MIISFLASHGGSSARALIKSMQDGDIAARPGIVITNNRDSAIFHWCLDHDIPVRHISAKTHRGAEHADEAIADVLREAGTTLLVCSGYMKTVGPRVLHALPGHVLNIHPALLPAHGGKGMYGDHVHAAVLAAREPETGATVHIVTDGIDEGPIVLQRAVSVMPDDSLETLRARVQGIEPQLYIDAVKLFMKRHHAM
jgi:phosphoribosylglycinamide formyltransferase-1